MQTAREKVQAIMNSPHITVVEIGFEDEYGGIRFYTAITKETGIPHRYTVRIWEDEQGRIARCNCKAGARYDICRHLLAAVKADDARTGRTHNPERFTGYKAHKQIGHVGICDLCGKASRDGGIHYECHRYEEFLADRASEELERIAA